MTTLNRRLSHRIEKRAYALDNELIAQFAPSVFAANPYPDASSRYGFVRTIDVIDRLRNEGFGVVKAAQTLVRSNANEVFGKHLIVFRRNADIDWVPTAGVVIPEIVLTNSHDGKSAYSISAGLFRCVCINGLIVSDGNLFSYKIPHKGDVIDLVLDKTDGVYKLLPEVMNRVEGWKSLRLDEENMLGFATSALALRYGDTPTRVRPEQLLAPRRRADEYSDLWTTFNIVQENVMRGGAVLEKTENTRASKSKPVTSVAEDIRFNTALWQVASNYYDVLAEDANVIDIEPVEV